MPVVGGPFKKVQEAAVAARRKVTALQNAGDFHGASNLALQFSQAMLRLAERRDADGGEAANVRFADHMMTTGSRIGGLKDEPGKGKQPPLRYEEEGS